MKSKHYPTLLTCVFAVTVLAVACMTTSQLARVTRVTREAAEAGTFESLAQKPEWRPRFVQAQADLETLSHSPTIVVEDLFKVIDRLPVKELKSDNARLAIIGAKLVISGIGVPEMPAEQAGQLQSIAAGAAAGIAAGLK